LPQPIRSALERCPLFSPNPAGVGVIEVELLLVLAFWVCGFSWPGSVSANAWRLRSAWTPALNAEMDGEGRGVDVAGGGDALARKLRKEGLISSGNPRSTRPALMQANS
jgi:hypothetical protein